MSDARESLNAVRAEVAKAVVGQDGAVTALLAAVLVGGHVLIEGVPGVAKTLLAKTVAASLSLDSGRLQFTPDLMPSDVVGHLVLDGNALRFDPGPVFTNVLVADEINRTPPKTQAALLEAMEEHHVTSGGATHPLPDPFIVVATQNPAEYEGTYPLPEAQLDRFLFKIEVGYPSADEEIEVVRRHHAGLDPHDVASAGVTAVAGAAELVAARREVEAVTVDDDVVNYMVALVRATRSSPSVSLGVSPRGSAALLRASKAAAWIAGSDFVTPDHVKTVAPLVFAHRLTLRPEVELDGATPAAVVKSVLASVAVPR